MVEANFRVERDSMGEIKVPEGVYWGAQTQRAIENFPISKLRFPGRFIRALGMIKMGAAEANMELGLLDKKFGKAVQQGAKEVMKGEFEDHFVVDIFQTGSGTSTNMNANEVIANRANELLGEKKVHPNDHVNMGQSSNDVIPAAIHAAALEATDKELLPALNELHRALEDKAKEFNSIIKIGRTHLQDAVPLRLGQEFGGYASMIKHGIKRIDRTRRDLAELAIGGTAVGTGINTHPKFAELVIKRINKITNLSFKEAENHFEAQGSKDALVETSSALKTLAVSLMKMANDLRLLNSGPRCGIGEITVPSLQPGSSIMPGKVNPVVAEMVCQVSAKVMGNDATITVSGLSGNLELNTMMPVIGYCLLESIEILTNATLVFTEKCIREIRANEERCLENIEKSLGLATGLTPYIGYDEAAKIAKEAHERGKTVREVAIEKHLLPKEKIEKALDPATMAGLKKEDYI